MSKCFIFRIDRGNEFIIKEDIKEEEWIKNYHWKDEAIYKFEYVKKKS
ncbi:MAG: hypothetical protein ACRCXY_10975 [Fusobacteriaceae bacterium]